jgi:ribosomal protein L11 methylase PrmA
LHLAVHTSAPCLDAVANFLIESGSSGVILKRRAVEAYFPNNRNAAALKRAVHSFVMDVVKLQGRSSKPRLSWQIARPEHWQNSWKRFIRPSRVGNQFWLTPPWLTPPQFRSRQVITIEPGMEYAPGKMIVHEENIVVREEGAELLSRRAPREMWIVDA